MMYVLVDLVHMETAALFPIWTDIETMIYTYKS